MMSLHSSYLTLQCYSITGESFNISVQFTPAKNYPLDLYFLMDLSNSMGEHRRNVEKFGSELARKMRNITSNFKLGFGSFVDKDTIPIAYNKIDPDRCFNDKGDIVCRDTYSFKHRMTMDSKEDRFVVCHCD
jgi:Integrin beta chain VWA domain